MTIYNRNPLLMTVMGANPGWPAFIVLDSRTGRVMYTKRATGTGGQAISLCADAARRLARRNGCSYIVFLDTSGAHVGDERSVVWARMLGITEEVHPDGRVTRGNPPRRRRSPESEVDTMIGAAWARFMSGVQVSVMEIPKIFRDIKLEMSGGMTLEDAVKTVGNRYRVNPGRYRRNPIGEAIIAGATGALVNRALQSNPHLEGEPCSSCGGELNYLGKLGNREHYRCRNCGLDSSVLVDEQRTRQTPRRPLRKVPRPGIRYNPAIRREWERLTGRRRLAVLEFAGIPYDQARRLASRSWETLPPSIQDEVSKGWRENSSSKRPAIRMNPAPRGKRRLTLTVEQFANWVKRQNNREMWKAFLAKFKGYENWTHGAKARKVTLEWIETPGVDGLWITYDGGKQPESTYIMPKGSMRKGAWKHPWDTMPDIKHDPEAGIVITKLRGKSRITDFYHK